MSECEPLHGKPAYVERNGCLLAHSLTRSPGGFLEVQRSFRSLDMVVVGPCDRHERTDSHCVRLVNSRELNNHRLTRIGLPRFRNNANIIIQGRQHPLRALVPQGRLEARCAWEMVQNERRVNAPRGADVRRSTDRLTCEVADLPVGVADQGQKKPHLERNGGVELSANVAGRGKHRRLHSRARRTVKDWSVRAGDKGGGGAR